MLKNYWQECCEDYRTPQPSAQPALAELERIGENLRNGVPGVSCQDYMQAQLNVWKEIRGLGNPWLVTDLITLGSPLAHAALLLADDEADLRTRQRQRELPTNPPEPEIEMTGGGPHCHYSYRVWDGYGPNKDIKLRAIHYGAPFACTRWTNLYFPAASGMFGDLVGGPLQPWFGPGIRDIAVRSGNRFRDHTVAAHVTYWDKDSAGTSATVPNLPFALTTLIDVLNLQDKTYFADTPPAAQN